jgi:hypothetical protein
VPVSAAAPSWLRASRQSRAAALAPWVPPRAHTPGRVRLRERLLHACVPPRTGMVRLRSTQCESPGRLASGASMKQFAYRLTTGKHEAIAYRLLPPSGGTTTSSISSSGGSMASSISSAAARLPRALLIPPLDLISGKFRICATDWGFHKNSERCDLILSLNCTKAWS